MQAALQGTNFYESYTGVELPLTKLDMMGIPGRGGAVENWGLIQFDERRMLFNEVCLSLVSWPHSILVYQHLVTSCCIKLGWRLLLVSTSSAKISFQSTVSAHTHRLLNLAGCFVQPLTACCTFQQNDS